MFVKKIEKSVHSTLDSGLKSHSFQPKRYFVRALVSIKKQDFTNFPKNIPRHAR
jgi:hypothetical protein